jgi:hypothetical protein
MEIRNNIDLTQFITFDSYDHYSSWNAHIDGATALLQLRGQEQFGHELGAQLFTQLRSQVVSLALN